LPPDVGAVWHNSFHEQLEDNAGAIEDMLAAAASVLSASLNPETLQLAAEIHDLATSKAEAIQLSRRIGQAQLNLPLNRDFDGRLMCIRQENMPPPIAVGPLRFTVIGPRSQDLEALRKEWKEWLRVSKTKEQLRTMRKRARRDERDLIGLEARDFREALHDDAEELREAMTRAPAGAIDAAFRLGKRSSVRSTCATSPTG
jgi:hypothetical protein